MKVKYMYKTLNGLSKAPKADFESHYNQGTDNQHTCNFKEPGFLCTCVFYVLFHIKPITAKHFIRVEIILFTLGNKY